MRNVPEIATRFFVFGTGRLVPRGFSPDRSAGMVSVFHGRQGGFDRGRIPVRRISGRRGRFFSVISAEPLEQGGQRGVFLFQAGDFRRKFLIFLSKHTGQTVDFLFQLIMQKVAPRAFFVGVKTLPALGFDLSHRFFDERAVFHQQIAEFVLIPQHFFVVAAGECKQRFPHGDALGFLTEHSQQKFFLTLFGKGFALFGFQRAPA